MKVDFILKETSFKNDSGQEIKYFILERQLVDGTNLQLAIKGDKAKLLKLSLALENRK